MSEKAWVMVVSRENPHDFVIRELRDVPYYMVTFGLYDIVVEVTGKTIEELYEHIRKIRVLAGVASATPYLCAKKGKKEAQRANTCILVDTSPQDVEFCWRRIQEMNGVLEADIVFGVFDIVALAHVPTNRMAALLEKIRGIAGIIRIIAMRKLSDPNELPLAPLLNY